MTEATLHLLDVNVLVALLDNDHRHHQAAEQWFYRPGLAWAVCAFVEAGLLRHMTRSETGGLSMDEATAMLDRLAETPGYHYQPIPANWRRLCQPLFGRLYGHRQITDAFLLGLAIHAGLVLATFDQAMIHLAGEYRRHVLLLAPK